jgi:hypothetical protein
MEDKIFNIVTDLIRDDITKDEAIEKLLVLYGVSVSFLYDFVNKFTDTEIPKEAIKETLNQLNER